MKSIYYRQPYQEILVKEVKAPLNEALAVITSPGSGGLEKARAVLKLRKVIKVIMEQLPEPTIENTFHHNTHILIGIRDRFFKRFTVFSRWDFLKAIVDFVIIVHDTDFYRPFIGWWVEELRASDWRPGGPMQPDPHHFKEENNSGGITK